MGKKGHLTFRRGTSAPHAHPQIRHWRQLIISKVLTLKIKTLKANYEISKINQGESKTIYVMMTSQKVKMSHGVIYKKI